MVELRKLLLLPLDDLLVVAREFVCPALSRSALDRCLRRHGVARLADLLPEAEGNPPLPKTFKDYEPGFVHVDVKYLPRMPDEAEHRYLIAAMGLKVGQNLKMCIRDSAVTAQTPIQRRARQRRTDELAGHHQQVDVYKRQDARSESRNLGYC